MLQKLIAEETNALSLDGCFIRHNKAEKIEIQFHSVILAMMADLQISVLIQSVMWNLNV